MPQNITNKKLLIPEFSHKFFDWKLGLVDSRYISVFKENEIIAVFVLNCSEDAYIVATFTDEDNLQEYTISLACLINYIKKDYNSIKIWIPQNENTAQKIKPYKKSGFIINRRKDTYRFIKKILTDDASKQYLQNPENWKPQQFDADNLIKLG